MRNRPYVKKTNELGQIINPIISGYTTEYETRQQRRAHLNQPPFVGNGENYHLSVTKISKHKRVDGKNINHYIES